MLGNNNHVLTWIDAPWRAGGPLPPKVFCVDGREIGFRFNPPIPFPLETLGLTPPYVASPDIPPFTLRPPQTPFDRAMVLISMVQNGVQEWSGWTPTAYTVFALLWPTLPNPFPVVPYEEDTPNNWSWPNVAPVETFPGGNPPNP